MPDRPQPTPEEMRARRARALENSHREEYESSLALADHPGPAWDDLAEEKREEIREINRQYWRELQEFGRTLAAGRF